MCRSHRGVGRAIATGRADRERRHRRAQVSSQPVRELPPRVVLLTLSLVVALSIAVSGAGPAGAQTDPDFTNVSDVLQGRRRLLPIDDLIVTSPTGSAGAVNNLVLPTSNSSIGTQFSYPVTTASVPSF